MKTQIRNFLFLVIVLSGIVVFAQKGSHKCGTWRWNVKTLTDKGGSDLLSMRPVKTTLDQLVIVKPTQILHDNSPSDGKTPRLARENQVVEITAYVKEVKHEKDHDLHFVLQSPDSENTMVGEIPDPACPDFDNFPVLRKHFEKTREDGMKIWDIRRETHKPVKVKITGVPFWDGAHPVAPTGASQYFREIHPILTIEVLQ